MKRNRTLLVTTTATAAVAGLVCTFVLMRLIIVPPEVGTIRASIHPVEKLVEEQQTVVRVEQHASEVKPTFPQALPQFVSPSVRLSTWSTNVEQSQIASLQPEKQSPVTKSPVRAKKRVSSRQRRKRKHTLASRLAVIEPTAKPRLAARFAAAKIAWPPTKVAFVAIKDEKRLELYAQSAGAAWKLVHRYRVLAASGGAGPKLRRGDKQVPEGMYRITYLNPNSAFHVSLRPASVTSRSVELA